MCHIFVQDIQEYKQLRELPEKSDRNVGVGGGGGGGLKTDIWLQDRLEDLLHVTLTLKR